MSEAAAIETLEADIASPASVLLRRRQIRRSLVAWAEECGFSPALHHRFIIDKLEAVTRGELRRLMILVPPGAAKSTYASVLFPPWFLAQRPGNAILTCSYSFTLAERFGKRCRNLIQEKHNVLGFKLDRRSEAAGDWATSTGSVYFAAGVGAGIAGHRADLGLIDDYLGSQEDADSQLIRDKQWDWYLNDFYPRLKPQATQIIIANRRHEDDLVGRIIAKEQDKWTIIKLPMLAEDNDPLGRSPGQRLWPEWYTQEMVDDVKQYPRVWSGLYQQNPTPEEGSYFKRDMILTYEPNQLPKELRKYAGSDFAVRRSQSSDSTCHVVGGVDSTGRLWILPDWFWKRCDTLEASESMFEIERRHHPICWWIGREVITGSIGPFLYQKMKEDGCYVCIDELSEAKDKEAKAQSIKARMSAKMVMFPHFVPQWSEALHELLTFPGGTHDDFVDALAKLGQGLSKMAPAESPTATWDGFIPQVRLTCGWVERSHRRKVRERERAMADW